MAKNLEVDKGYIRALAKLEERIQSLRQSKARLLRRLEQEKEKRQELRTALRLAIKDCIDAIALPDVQCQADQGRSDGHPEQAIFVLSDWQIGKTTPTYSTAICEARIHEYIKRSLHIVAMHREMKRVDTARVYLLGDIVEGELIFPGQAHEIDSSLFKQAATDAPRVISWVLRELASNFENVFVVCIHGNHGSLGGRQRREYRPDSNADNFAYEISRALTSQIHNVKWLWPQCVKHWYATDQIGKKKFLLFHGDQMRGGGFAGIPFYAFSRAIHSWASGAIPESFDYAICGHWHQGASLPFNFRTLWINGSVESYNVYAQEQLKSMSAPHQWLLFCHPEKGVTAEYRIWLSANPYGYSKGSRGGKRNRIN